MTSVHGCGRSSPGGDISLPGTYEWFSNYFWIPIIGPLIGGVIGALVYDLLISQVLTARGEEEPEAGRVP